MRQGSKDWTKIIKVSPRFPGFWGSMSNAAPPYLVRCQHHILPFSDWLWKHGVVQLWECTTLISSTHFHFGQPFFSPRNWERDALKVLGTPALRWLLEWTNPANNSTKGIKLWKLKSAIENHLKEESIHCTFKGRKGKGFIDDLGKEINVRHHCWENSISSMHQPNLYTSQARNQTLRGQLQNLVTFIWVKAVFKVSRAHAKVKLAIFKNLSCSRSFLLLLFIDC